MEIYDIVLILFLNFGISRIDATSKKFRELLNDCTMEIVLNKILLQINNREDKLSGQMVQAAYESYQMTLFLKEMLYYLKERVL